jgi:hypothetical protein
MATSLEQQSARRKFIYFGLILLLFTVSLMHRKLVINAKADELLMRDVSRGKADLTDSALRLTLSGFRGVAATSLWLAAIEKQKRHEWNEMEVVVDSLTRLQPRFMAPWLFQSWNLAFNVAVECDVIRDKYYYITRGINLLAVGEAKNDPGQAEPPQPWPASAEMRYQVGFTYQLKIGQGDENKSLRCCFDVSCIPPSQRRPEDFYIEDARGRRVDLKKFMKFCETYPRLVRRLREKLSGFEKPESIVQYLADNKDIPTREENRNQMKAGQRLAEFPVLPPQTPDVPPLYKYPDWTDQNLSTAVFDFDVYKCTQAWYSYAQLPLPPVDPNAGVPDPRDDPEKYAYNRLKHRVPKMTTIIFRTYPGRAQAYYAEELQKDGWFDGSGWLITGWFDNLMTADGKVEVAPRVIAGTGKKYDSSDAWAKAYEMYLDYGLKNGVYIPPDQLKKWTAEAARQGPSSFAAKKLVGWEQARQLTNFEAFLRQAEVERTPEAVAARKAIYEVKHTEAANPNVVNIYRERVLPQWLDLLLRYPEFRQIGNIQEESYELQAEYFRLLQYYNKALFEKLATGMAYAATPWPTPGTVALFDVPGMARMVTGTVGMLPLPGTVALLDPDHHQVQVWPHLILKLAVEKKGVKILYIREVEGLYDQLWVLDAPKEKLDKINPLALSAVARLAVWPPPPDDPKTPDFAFSRYVFWPPLPGAGLNPEVGLGLQSVWPPAKVWPAADSVTMLAGAAMGVTIPEMPRPLFMMLSSHEQRRILTLVASQRLAPAGQNWKPLIPLPVVEQVQQTINWMRARIQQPTPPPVGEQQGKQN